MTNQIEKKYIRLTIDVDAAVGKLALEEICTNIQNEVAYHYDHYEGGETTPDVHRTNVTRVFKMVSEEVGDAPTRTVKLQNKKLCPDCGFLVTLTSSGKLYKHDRLGKMPNFSHKLEDSEVCCGTGLIIDKE